MQTTMNAGRTKCRNAAGKSGPKRKKVRAPEVEVTDQKASGSRTFQDRSKLKLRLVLKGTPIFSNLLPKDGKEGVRVSTSADAPLAQSKFEFPLYGSSP